MWAAAPVRLAVSEGLSCSQRGVSGSAHAAARPSCSSCAAGQGSSAISTSALSPMDVSLLTLAPAATTIHANYEKSA